MASRGVPIRRRLMTMMLLTSGAALLLMSTALLAYEMQTFRDTALRQLATLGQVLAANSTAALAFDNADDATETLAALHAEPHVVAAELYDVHGRPFARYPAAPADSLPAAPGADGYRYAQGRVLGFAPVVQGQRRQGTLFLEADMGALYERLRLYGAIAALVFAVAMLVAYLLSRTLQTQISGPILVLADVARAVSDRQDYSVRAPPQATSELGSLTEAFNHMLGQIAEQNAELQQSGDALRASEQSLATTLDSIADAVIATDTSGRVIRMNPVAEHLTGWARNDAVSRPLDEVLQFVDEGAGGPLENPVARIVRDGVVIGQSNHTSLRARDGTSRPVAHRAAPIRDFMGTIRGVVLVFRDQTEERRAEEMRVRSVQLEAQNQHVREASRLKSEFLANMSHELRTPLNGIIGFAEILRDGRAGPLSEDQTEYMGDILTSGQHLLQLINDVLDLSKVEAGKLEFRSEPVDLARLIAEVLGVVRATIATKAIRVEPRVDPILTDVELDASRFKQVLYNYVSNALKFTPDGGRVTVRATPEPDGTRFRLEVEDTGPGISPDDIGRLFVEFQQLDAGAAKRHGGTGLGLALTKRLVEAQGGAVGLRSVVGRGSVFFAVLPRRAEAGAPMPSAAAPDVVPDSAPAVLVVDGDPHDQAVITRALADIGFAVVVAATGAEALEHCRARTFAAITLDLLLPDMSGLDVLQAIGSGAANRDVPVVIVTVVTEVGAVAGFAVHDLIAKPLDPAALVASLKRARVSPEGSGAVLVVDDDPSSRKLMLATLAEFGYRATGAANGEEGLAAARAAAPLAIVLDLMMPGMDGFEFLDELRRVPACRRVPVIVWSVKDLTAAERARLRRTAQGVVAKGRVRSSSVVDQLRILLPALAAPEAAGGVHVR